MSRWGRKDPRSPSLRTCRTNLDQSDARVLVRVPRLPWKTQGTGGKGTHAPSGPASKWYMVTGTTHTTSMDDSEVHGTECNGAGVAPASPTASLRASCCTVPYGV